MQERIRYHKINLEDRELMMTMYAQDPRRTCEHCFANNYLWQSVYPAEMAEFDGCISVRFYDGADLYYDFPSGPGDKQQALERILEWTKRQDALRFYGLLRDEVELLEKWHPGGIYHYAGTGYLRLYL